MRNTESKPLRFNSYFVNSPGSSSRKLWYCFTQEKKNGFLQLIYLPVLFLLFLKQGFFLSMFTTQEKWQRFYFCFAFFLAPKFMKLIFWECTKALNGIHIHWGNTLNSWCFCKEECKQEKHKSVRKRWTYKFKM